MDVAPAAVIDQLRAIAPNSLDAGGYARPALQASSHQPAHDGDLQTEGDHLPGASLQSAFMPRRISQRWAAAGDSSASSPITTLLRRRGRVGRRVARVISIAHAHGGAPETTRGGRIGSTTGVW